MDVLPSPHAQKRVVLGRISGLFGVRGWVKVHAYTEPRSNILSYRSWCLCRGGDRRRYQVLEGRAQGKTLVARLEGVEDRDAAELLVGSTIEIARSELPDAEPGEYYWVDLEGLRVENREGRVLGRVDHMLATPAHDVMVLHGERERLVPFVQDVYVLKVDLAGGVIVVDWDPDSL